MAVVVDAYGRRHPTSGMTPQRYIRLKTIKRLGPDGCYEWHGKRNKAGYPEFPDSMHKKTGEWLVHRYVCKQRCLVHPRWHVDHKCRNRRCIRPSHLRPLPPRDNILDGNINVVKTECPAGHPYDEQNTYVWRGERHCRECVRRRNREYQRRRYARLKLST